jgi:F420-dependent oxidoreductase-like protein
MRAPITLSLHLPNFTFPDTPPEKLFDKLAEIAHTAETSGFSSITVMDHVHQIGPVGPVDTEMLEGNVALGALAAATETCSLGLLVGGVIYRNPALFAKLTTTLDIVSKGRAVLGIGAAWNEEESNAYGFDFPPLKERFERLEEALQIARLMFTQPRSSFSGKHYSIDGAYNIPQPIRGDIPILIGGSGEKKTLRFVAKYADACNIFGDVEGVKRLLGILDQHCSDVGRDPAEITKTRNGSFLIADTHEAAEAKLKQLVADGAIPESRVAATMYGSAEEVAEQAQAFKDAGLDALTGSIPDVWDLESVERVGQTIGPIFAG